jgi:hypothetical protein
MTYRIRKDKQNRYLPEMRGFSTLFMWWAVPDLAGHNSIVHGSLGRYTEYRARAIIKYYQDYESTKEEIIRIRNGN